MIKVIDLTYNDSKFGERRVQLNFGNYIRGEILSPTVIKLIFRDGEVETLDFDSAPNLISLLDSLSTFLLFFSETGYKAIDLT